MLHLEKVNGNNVWDILKLTVSESQKNFVATNDADLIGGNEVLLRFRYRQFQDIPDIITIYFF